MENLARKTDPQTSHLAAKAIKSKLGMRQRQTYQAVDNNPGATGGELARWLYETFPAVGFIEAASTPSRRLPELEKQGLVVRGKARECRESKKIAATWRLA